MSTIIGPFPHLGKRSVAVANFLRSSDLCGRTVEPTKSRLFSPYRLPLRNDPWLLMLSQTGQLRLPRSLLRILMLCFVHKAGWLGLSDMKRKQSTWYKALSIRKEIIFHYFWIKAQDWFAHYRISGLMTMQNCLKSASDKANSMIIVAIHGWFFSFQRICQKANTLKQACTIADCKSICQLRRKRKKGRKSKPTGFRSLARLLI